MAICTENSYADDYSKLLLALFVHFYIKVYSLESINKTWIAVCNGHIKERKYLTLFSMLDIGITKAEVKNLNAMHKIL